MTYQDSIDWLYSTQMFGIKLGLEGPIHLLREFLAFPRHGVKVIQVAGTNGKGSTCAYIDSVARACGYRTGLFTSPHLIDYRERILVSGQEIDQITCAQNLTKLRSIAEHLDHHPTFFELSLACAMRYFYEKRCEIIILETGMGGRLDATTAVPTDVSIITPIGLDHTHWLGETLTEIANEKAGIMHEGVPVFSAQQAPEVTEVLKKQANQTRCLIEFITEALTGYPISLPGQHQRENAALALAAVHALNLPLSYDVVYEGLSTAQHSGRFERFSPDRTGRSDELIIDAAHNPTAAAALTSTWHEVYGDKPYALIFGAVSDKDISGILNELTPLASEIHFVPTNSQRGVPPDALIEQVDQFTGQITIHASVTSALEATSQLLMPTLLTGSIFLLGEAKAILQDQPHRASTQ